MSACVFGSSSLQHVRGLPAREVRENRRDDLRMLGFHDLGDRARLHPLQGIDAGRFPALEDSAEQRTGASLAERIGHDLLQVIVRADADRRLALDRDEHLTEHVGHALARHVGKAGHRKPELLHLFDVHVPQHGSRGLLTESHQENCGTFGALDLRCFSHCLQLTQLRTT